MNLFDKVNIKSVIIVTSLAAVLSVIAGGIGGVSTGTLLVRAALFSVVFGAGTVLVNLVVDAFLPELKGRPAEEESAGNEEETGEGTTGQNINIVMDDEAGESDGISREAGELSVSPDSVDLAGEAAVSSEGDDEFTPVSPDQIARGGALPDIGAFSSVDDDEEDEAEDLVSAEEEEPVSGGSRVRFSSVQASDDEKISFFQTNTSAEELAKGVRTMLKRDDKG